MYNFRQARRDILQWKAYTLRSVNQKKQDQLQITTNNSNYALSNIDREKQSDCYGKKGLSWHTPTVIFSDPDKVGSLELQFFAHPFDICRQDWFAVSSIIENTLEMIKTQKPHVTQVYLHSDEACCYQTTL